MASQRHPAKKVVSAPMERKLAEAIENWAKANGIPNTTAAIKLMARYVLIRQMTKKEILSEFDRRGIEWPSDVE